MELLKLIKNRISSEWKKTFNDNVDILNGITKKQDEKIDVVGKRIDNLVLHSGGDSPNEVVDARVNNKGEAFSSLTSRIITSENRNEEEFGALNKMQSEQKDQLSQLNEVIRLLYNSNGASVSIYVSASKGNDRIGDGTEENPFQTIQTAVNQIPFINSSSTTIFVDSGVYLEDVKISNLIAPRINIRSLQSTAGGTDAGANELPVKLRSILASNCNAQFWLFGIQFVDQANAPKIRYPYAAAITDAGALTIEKCAFRENTKGIADFRAIQTAGRTSLHCMRSDVKDQNVAFYADTGSELRVGGGNSGTGNSTVFYAENSTIRSSANVSGTTTNQLAGSGLIITKGTVL